MTTKRTMLVLVAAILPAPLVWAKSTLEFRLERYDIDANCPAAGAGICEAREEYEKSHPHRLTLRLLRSRLGAIRREAACTEDLYTDLDQTVTSLFGQAGVRAQGKAGAIEDAFAPFRRAVESELATIDELIQKHGEARIAGPLGTDVACSWHEAEGKLKSAGVVMEPAAIEGVLAQLASLGDAISALALSTGEDLSGRLRDLESRGCRAPALAEALARLPARADGLERIGAGIAALSADAAAAKQVLSDATRTLQTSTGDLLARPFEVYQDLSDPFLMYIAAHPDNWRALDNRAWIEGHGDTEFILVFENHLDARFKFVAADPSRIVKARATMLRGTAKAMLGLLGIAGRAFNVPLPPDVSDKSGSADFSQMTAAAALRLARVESEAKGIADVREFAAGRVGGIDERNMVDLLDELIRRLKPIEKTPKP